MDDCPMPYFTALQPTNNVTTVEGYNATFKCSFDGHYARSSPIRVWALFPASRAAVWLNEFSHADCKCWVELTPACPVGTDPNDCCRFELLVYSTPIHRTVFSCTKNFTDVNITWMFVLPSPKVLELPHDLSVAVGSKATFTCDFEASTDSKITQIHWEFDGNDLAGCTRFQDTVNCTVTQHFSGSNYISSSLKIYSVQAHNAGQYTCYCSYNTSTLNVGGVEVIQSEYKSATLSILPGSFFEENLAMVVSVGIFVAILIIGFASVVICCVYACHRRSLQAEKSDKTSSEITDEILDQYLIEELFPLWFQLGKALDVSDKFLEEDLPTDKAERLKAILREWKDKDKSASLKKLNKKILMLQIGLPDIISQQNA